MKRPNQTQADFRNARRAGWQLREEEKEEGEKEEGEKEEVQVEEEEDLNKGSKMGQEEEEVVFGGKGKMSDLPFCRAAVRKIQLTNKFQTIIYYFYYIVGNLIQEGKLLLPMLQVLWE